jgi:transcriptional regulator with XRE-family HTH domain
MSIDPIKRLPVAFGNLLKRLRVKLNLSQEGLAVAAGFPDTNAVVDIECGEREPTLTELFRIANALRMPQAILFVDVVAEWRNDPTDYGIYKTRASDFTRLYRLGYQHKPADFREQDRTYGSVAEAINFADRLNKQRHDRKVALLDTVCIYIRMGYTSFRWMPDSDKDTNEVEP